jgi:hypothetical protein
MINNYNKYSIQTHLQKEVFQNLVNISFHNHLPGYTYTIILIGAPAWCNTIQNVTNVLNI